MKERPILFSAPMVRAILDGRKTQTRRVVKPGSTQTWMPNGVPSAVARWEHRKDGWWSMQVGTPERIVHCGVEMDGGHIGCIRCPYGVPGARLWVKETFRVHGDCGRDKASTSTCTGPDDCEFAADFNGMELDAREWRPSIHMPRWASRITLEVIGVRVERLQEISEADAKAEGIYSACIHVPPPIHTETRYVAPGVKMVNAADEVDYEAPAHRTAKHAFECLWESINGYGSWSVNPWVWVVEFKRIKP